MRQPRLTESLLPHLVILAALAMIPLISWWLRDPFLIRLFTRIVIFAAAAVALNLVLGFAGLVSLLHAGFMGMGGYVVGILAFHESNAVPLGFGMFVIPGTSDLLIGLPVAAVACALLAVLTGLVCLRSVGVYFIMITLAFNQMIYYFFVALQIYGGDDGLQITVPLYIGGARLPKGAGYFYICLAFLALVLLLFRRIVGSEFGVVLGALRQNERRVAAVGVPALAYKLVAFAISGAVAGIAGIFLAGSQNFVSPADLSWIRSADLAIVAVLGGVSVTWGPVLGAVAFYVAELWLSSLTVHWLLPFGILVILIGALLNGGLADIVALPFRPRPKQGAK
jgi:branched-chain amino acid transport system permease protein